MSTTVIAKVFKAGNSKALRLPRGLDVKAKSYEVTPTATGFMVVDPKAEARRLKALQALRGSAPKFPDHTT
jgi:antitoxin VapB